MNLNKEPTTQNYLNYLFIAIIILLCIRTCTLNKTANELSTTEKELRNKLLDSDKLVRLKSGAYHRLLDDRYTDREILKLLEKENKELSEELGKSKSKPILRVSSKLKLKDTIVIPEITFVNDSINITSYFPNKDNSLIRVKTVGKLSETILTDWKFEEMPISVTVAENKDGTFSVLMDSDHFMVSQLDVVGVRLINKTQPKWGLLYGLGLSSNLNNKSIGIGLGGGIRYNKNYITSNIYTNNQLTINYYKHF